MTERRQITELEIRALLAVVMAYDNRRPGEANVTAWLEQGIRCRWTYDEAREAVHAHFAASTDFLMPAHITAHIRAERQKQPAAYAELEPAQPANPERVASIVAALASRLGWRRVAARDDPALQVECRICHAAPRVRCSMPITRGHHQGERRYLSNPHPSRVDDAQKAS
jgi:hypothetical protein